MRPKDMTTFWLRFFLLMLIALLGFTSAAWSLKKVFLFIGWEVNEWIVLILFLIAGVWIGRIVVNMPFFQFPKKNEYGER